MNREEYMSRLREALACFDQEIRDEIINDYEEHFEMGAMNGKTEEQIAQELGSIEELVGELTELAKHAGDTGKTVSGQDGAGEAGADGLTAEEIAKKLGIFGAEIYRKGSEFATKYARKAKYYGEKIADKVSEKAKEFGEEMNNKYGDKAQAFEEDLSEKAKEYGSGIADTVKEYGSELAGMAGELAGMAKDFAERTMGGGKTQGNASEDSADTTGRDGQYDDGAASADGQTAQAGTADWQTAAETDSSSSGQSVEDSIKSFLGDCFIGATKLAKAVGQGAGKVGQSAGKFGADAVKFAKDFARSFDDTIKSESEDSEDEAESSESETSDYGCDEDGIDKVIIDAGCADVTVCESTDNSVNLNYENNGSANSKMAYRFYHYQEGRTIYAGVERVGTKSRFFSNFNAADINLRVAVPENLRSLSVKTTSGDIDCSGITVKGLELTTASGDIDLSDSTCNEAIGHTASGDITVDNLSAVTGGFTTASGDIDVDGDRIASVRLESASGDCDFDGAARKVFSHTASGDVDLKVDGVSEINVSTASGDIDIVLESSDGFTAEVTTINGTIDLVSDDESRENVRNGSYTFGAGETVLNLSSVSGDIDVRN